MHEYLLKQLCSTIYNLGFQISSSLEFSSSTSDMLLKKCSAPLDSSCAKVSKLLILHWFYRENPFIFNYLPVNYKL